MSGSAASTSLTTLGNALFYSDINVLYYSPGNTKGIVLSNLDAVSIKIIHILGTNIGSYEFEPTFGSNLPYLLWEPCDEITGWKLRTATVEALSKWLPIIQIDISATSWTPGLDGMSYIGQISYSVIATGAYSVLSLTVPTNS